MDKKKFEKNLQFFLKRFYLFIFRERGRRVESEEDKYQCERETLTGCPLHEPCEGTESATQACTLTGNQTAVFYFVG